MTKEKKQPKKTVITNPEEGAVWHEHIYSHKVKSNIKLEVR